MTQQTEADSHTLARLHRIHLHRLQLPLTEPYENALCRLIHFDAFLITLVDEDGRVGIGEACPVTGYSPETPDEAEQWARAQLPGLVGLTPDGVIERLQTQLHTAPFMVSAVLEALAELGADPLLTITPGNRIRLLGTVNTLDSKAAPAYAEALLAAGYTTLKVKVGYDPGADAERVCALADVVSGRGILRMDANQGYTLEQARQFARRIPIEVVEVFEQPVPAERWDWVEALGRTSPLPLMLDESIYSDADIVRAGHLPGIKAVKLKMSKSGGPGALSRQVALAHAHGLDVVVGNGVASDLGCVHEAACCIQLGLGAAAEMNGFLKLREPLLAAPLALDNGCLVLPEPSAIALSPARIEASTTLSLSFPA